VRPESLWIIGLIFCIEKLGWGIGAVGHMVYMMQQIAPGPYRMAHYAFATGFGLSMCMTVTGAASGYIQQAVGYQTYFIIVLLASAAPSLLFNRDSALPSRRCLGRSRGQVDSRRLRATYIDRTMTSLTSTHGYVAYFRTAVRLGLLFGRRGFDPAAQGRPTMCSGERCVAMVALSPTMGRQTNAKARAGTGGGNRRAHRGRGIARTDSARVPP